MKNSALSLRGNTYVGGDPGWGLKVVSGEIGGDDSPDLGRDLAADVTDRDVVEGPHGRPKPWVVKMMVHRPPFPGAVFDEPDGSIGRGVGKLGGILQPLARSIGRLKQVGRHKPGAYVDPAHSEAAAGLLV